MSSKPGATPVVADAGQIKRSFPGQDRLTKRPFESVAISAFERRAGTDPASGAFTSGWVIRPRGGERWRRNRPSNPYSSGS